MESVNAVGIRAVGNFLSHVVDLQADWALVRQYATTPNPLVLHHFLDFIVGYPWLWDDPAFCLSVAIFIGINIASVL